jgi:hypothetical protein
MEASEVYEFALFQNTEHSKKTTVLSVFNGYEISPLLEEHKWK